MTINLTVPNLSELKPRITVFGVGGAGGNAVNNMIESQLEGVEFVIANTDAQAMTASAAERRIQMGNALTQGLGAGSRPQIGAGAAEEALPEIMDHLAGAHMVFITAGMGGGTGTGAAPVIARAAKEQGILTVGVVTKPFHFEGQQRMFTAERGIEQLASHVDTLIVIPNQNLFRVANEKTTFAAAFSMADQVLYSGVASITELMTKDGLINLDFADVRSIMSEMGKAMMGTGEASGEKRAIEAAEAAISNPLLDDVSMRGARGLLISISGGPDLTLYEVDEAATRIREEVDPEANIILGATFDEKLDGTMRVSVVATGLAVSEEQDGQETDMTAESGGTSHYRTPAPAPAPEVELPPAAAQPQPAPAMAEAPRDIVAEQPEIAAPEMPAPPRMPSIDDFPPNVREQMGQAPVEDAGTAGRKPKGLFGRIVDAGLGRTEAHGHENAGRPVMPMAPRPSAPAAPEMPAAPGPDAAASNVHPISPEIDPQLDDDQLEIPAFLRRKAN